MRSANCGGRAGAVPGAGVVPGICGMLSGEVPICGVKGRRAVRKREERRCGPPGMWRRRRCGSGAMLGMSPDGAGDRRGNVGRSKDWAAAGAAGTVETTAAASANRTREELRPAVMTPSGGGTMWLFWCGNGAGASPFGAFRRRSDDRSPWRRAGTGLGEPRRPGDPMSAPAANAALVAHLKTRRSTPFALMQGPGRTMRRSTPCSKSPPACLTTASSRPGASWSSARMPQAPRRGAGAHRRRR